MSQHTADHHQVTTAATEMILISDGTLPAVDAELRYYCDDPFAVQMLLSVDQSPAISWMFGRELLMTGVCMPAGIGDVQVYPTHDGVIIELRSGGAAASCWPTPRTSGTSPPRRSRLVPLGSEMDHYTSTSDLGSMPVHDALRGLTPSFAPVSDRSGAGRHRLRQPAVSPGEGN